MRAAWALAGATPSGARETRALPSQPEFARRKPTGGWRSALVQIKNLSLRMVF